MLGSLRKLLGLERGTPQPKPQAQRAQPLQYAQYMNPDGSGGGFGPNNPSPQQPRGIPLGGPAQGLTVADNNPQPQPYGQGFENDVQPGGFNPQTTSHAYYGVQGQYGGMPVQQDVVDPYGWLRTYLR